MVEFLDVYDANRHLLGSADRNVVHSYGLWHKTVHCWLVLRGTDGKLKLIFQRRSRMLNDNPGKLYTTASGHVSAGEALEEAFKREILQEIGVDITNMNPKHLYENIWIGDIKRKDGSLFVDRVFCNVYYAILDTDLNTLKFDDGEVDSVVAIDLDDIIDFTYDRIASLSGIEFDGIDIKDIFLTNDDFVLVGKETLYDKFGHIAEKIKSNFPIMK